MQYVDGLLRRCKDGLLNRPLHLPSCFFLNPSHQVSTYGLRKERGKTVMWSHRILVGIPSEARDLGFRMVHEDQESSSLRFSE